MKKTFLILSVVLCGCSDIETSKTETNKTLETKKTEVAISEANEDFQAFLENFQNLDLPIEIKGCESDTDNLTFLTEEKYGQFIKDDCYALGRIKTNGNYISVITLGLADCLLPEINTYKKSGEKIDNKTIAIGNCGFGPCFECSEFMTLKENYIIYTSDTITTSDCDDDMEPILGTESTKIIFKTGKLNETGTIELTDEQLINK